MTSAEDVLRQFCTSSATRSIFEVWQQKPCSALVVPVVLQHQARVVYQLSPDDVQEVCRRTEHALGDVKRTDGESVPAIVDWRPDFAFTHMFHVCMEQMGKLPAYQDFRWFADNTHIGSRMLGSPAREKVRMVIAGGVSEVIAKAAMRWRIGNAYYSFLREVYTVVQLRQRGVDLRLHPLADALFRVDAWSGRTALSLRVGNKKFRQGARDGRKTPPEQLLADLLPPFEFETIELPPATRFGRVHLPAVEDIEAAARLLSRG